MRQWLSKDMRDNVIVVRRQPEYVDRGKENPVKKQASIYSSSNHLNLLAYSAAF